MTSTDLPANAPALLGQAEKQLKSVCGHVHRAQNCEALDWKKRGAVRLGICEGPTHLPYQEQDDGLIIQFA